MPRESKTSGRRIKAKELQVQALELRKKRMSYREIAAELKCNTATAHDAVRRAIADIVAVREDLATEVLELELESYDALQKSRWDKAIAGDNAALDRVLRIMVQRAALLGLNAPEKRAVVVAQEGLTPETADKVRREILGLPSDDPSDAAESPSGAVIDATLGEVSDEH